MKFIKSGKGKWIQGKGYRKKVILREKDGIVVQIVVIAPHTEVKPHYHKKSKEAFHVLQGEGTMVISGKKFRLKPGDTLTCLPKEVHSAKNDSGKPFRYVVFKINAQEGDSYWLEE